MFKYERMLEYPLNIKRRDLKMANLLMAQLAGPDSELGASIRYFNQRYTMPDSRGKALLTDIATEELAHVEMIQSMIKQLIVGATIEEIKAAGFDKYYVKHKLGIFPADPDGVAFTTAYLQSTGDPIVDLWEDMAAEEKARATYENLMNMTNDPDVLAPLSFLRQREVIHFERFKELHDSYKKMGL